MSNFEKSKNEFAKKIKFYYTDFIFHFVIFLYLQVSRENTIFRHLNYSLILPVLILSGFHDDVVMYASSDGVDAYIGKGRCSRIQIMR